MSQDVSPATDSEFRAVLPCLDRSTAEENQVQCFPVIVGLVAVGDESVCGAGQSNEEEGDEGDEPWWRSRR